jgi:purine-binding chemotaxis protein CheW
MATDRQYCTFYLDGLYLGVEVQTVQEVIRYQHMTRVPLAPGVIRGLINLRGQIVTAIDLRTRLELAERPPDRQPMNVIVRTEEGPMSLLVDEIGDVVRVDEGTFEPIPDTLRGSVRALIRGAYKLPDRLLLSLNIQQAVCLPTDLTP